MHRLTEMTKLYITWVKSDIGYPEDQRQTIRALGFRRLGQTIVQEDSPPLRGMIKKVKHLVKVRVIENEAK